MIQKIKNRITQSPDVKPSMGLIEWAMLLALSILWGGSFLFQGIAVKELPTLSIVTLRVGLAAIVLWIIILVIKRHIPRDPKVWIAFLGMGLLNNVTPFILIVWGQQTIASGLASILNATTPLLTVIVAGLLLADERATPLKVMGVFIGLTGTIIMIGTEALYDLGQNFWAQAACLGAALSYAFAGVYGRRFKSMSIDPIVVAAGQVLASALILLPITLLIDQPWNLARPSPGTWISLLALAIFSTALAYILYFQILARAGATNLLLVTFLIPLSSVFLGSMILAEQLNWIHAKGMAFIAVGLLLIDGRLIKKIRK